MWPSGSQWLSMGWVVEAVVSSLKPVVGGHTILILGRMLAMVGGTG